MILKQAVPYTRLFMMIQSADHVSGLTGAAPVVKLTKCNIATGATTVVTATNSPATEVDSVNCPGTYKLTLSVTDLNTLGELGWHVTATNGDPTDFVDQVQAQWFTDLQLATNGRVLVSDNIQQNQPLNGFTFLMVDSITGAPKTGLTVTAQRSLAGAGFAPCANSVTELSNGIYTINLAATDTNAPTIMYRFTASGASDLDINIITTP